VKVVGDAFTNFPDALSHLVTKSALFATKPFFTPFVSLQLTFSTPIPCSPRRQSRRRLTSFKILSAMATITSKTATTDARAALTQSTAKKQPTQGTALKRKRGNEPTSVSTKKPRRGDAESVNSDDDDTREPSAVFSQQPSEATVLKRKRDDESTEIAIKRLKVSPVDYKETAGSRQSRRVAGLHPIEYTPSPPKPKPKPRPRPRTVANVDPAPQVSASPDISAEVEVDEPVQANHEFPTADTTVPDRDDNGPVQGQRASDRNAAQTEDFLRALVSNVAGHKLVRRMTFGHRIQVKRAAQIRVEIAEIAEKQHRLRQMERTMGTQQHDLELIEAMEDNEKQHAKCTVALKRFTNAAVMFESPLNSLNTSHASRSNEIYEFHDVDQGAAELKYLPARFWDEFDCCHKAHTTCNEIEEEIAAAERELDNVMEQSEELLISVICPRNSENHAGAKDVPTTPLVLTSKSAGVQLRAQGAVSDRLIALHERLDDARDEQYREEHTLHGTAEKVFIAAGFLAVDTEVEEYEFKRQIPSKINPPEDVQPHVQDSDKVELVSRVKHARKRLLDSRRKLDDARWEQLTNAGSMDSNERGAARVRRMIEHTREVRTAHEEYHSFLHNAQDEGAINDVDQWQNSKTTQVTATAMSRSDCRDSRCPRRRKNASTSG
jgi:hypothetical protein